jgi:hypothetical protein
VPAPIRLLSVLLAVCSTGCMHQFHWVAKSEAPREVKTEALLLHVNKIDSSVSGMASVIGWGVDVSVKNVSDHVAWFDPVDLVLLVPATGKKYLHNNKYVLPATSDHGGAMNVNGPQLGRTFGDSGLTLGVYDLWNVAAKNPLPPGGTYRARIWFEAAYGDNDIKSLDLSYGQQTLHFSE